ncbi:MAG: 3-dehydroquinate synthase family protein [Alkalispirochaeta sp.]
MRYRSTEITALHLGSYASHVLLCESVSDALVPLTTSGEDRQIDLIVADRNTAPLIPTAVSHPLVVLPAGEEAKQISVLEDLLESMVAAGLRRDSVVAAVGGGAITDVVACAGSLYLRGIDTILVPTTLLGMVDAAIGGKTGIDFGGFKNIVGTFAPAREVRIAPDFLSSLSDREFRSGLAEVIKAALLGDDRLLTILEEQADAVVRRERPVLEEVISRAVAVKAAVVQDDFTEQGKRAFLNLGHTFGHALEATAGLGALTHGEAVAWGIARAAAAAEHEGIGNPAWGDRTRAVLRRYGYDVSPCPAGVDPDEVIAAMQFDKKRRRQGLSFVVQTGPQRTETRILARETLLHILKEHEGDDR